MDRFRCKKQRQKQKKKRKETEPSTNQRPRRKGVAANRWQRFDDADGRLSSTRKQQQQQQQQQKQPEIDRRRYVPRDARRSMTGAATQRRRNWMTRSTRRFRAAALHCFWGLFFVFRVPSTAPGTFPGASLSSLCVLFGFVFASFIGNWPPSWPSCAAIERRDAE